MALFCRIFLHLNGELVMIEHRNEKGELHRTDGPAAVRADGYRAWYLNGKRHRTDGPAIEWPSGSREWWVDGEFIKSEYTKEKE
jgi:hypothetical protein